MNTTVPFDSVPIRAAFLDPKTGMRYTKVTDNSAELETQTNRWNPVLERFRFGPSEEVQPLGNS
jgi:hypothetical protein